MCTRAPSKLAGGVFVCGGGKWEQDRSDLPGPGGPAQCCARWVAPVLFLFWHSSRKAFVTMANWLELERVAGLDGVKTKVKPGVKAFTKNYLRWRRRVRVRSSGAGHATMVFSDAGEP